MKKILSLIALVVTLVACSKDETPGLSKEQIVGKWNVVQAWSDSQNAYINASILGWYAQFNSDGTYKGHDSGTYYGTYKINGNSVICTVGSEVVTYKMSSIIGNNADCEMSYKSEPGQSLKLKVNRE